MEKEAQESNKVKKARAKLKMIMDEEKKMITPENLQKVTQNIQKWIQRHASERTSLKDKRLSLFDENRHPAKSLSNYVHQLRNHLRTEFPEQKEEGEQEGENSISQPSTLRGRVQDTNREEESL